MTAENQSGDSGNLFDAIPDTLPTELFETLLQQAGCRIERIVSRGHRSAEGEWYDQAWDEWVLLIKGKAALEIEGCETLRQLIPGDYLLLPAHQRHRVAWTDNEEETVWLALHFNEASHKI